MNFVGKIGMIVWKDLTTEFRSKERLSAMLIFSFLVVVIFAFAFTPSRQIIDQVFPGMVWVAFSFAGILGLNRSFVAEKQNDCLLGLMLAPADRAVIYFGKVISNLVLVLIMEGISLPGFVILFNYRIKGSLPVILLVILLGTVGFIAIGTFLAALAANTRASEILLPLILFPIIIPVLIGAVQATAMALAGKPVSDFSSWLKLIGVYDVIFMVVPFVLFDYVLEV